MTTLRDLVVSTIVVGRMNPLIFSPEWLSTNNVIGPHEAAAARKSGIEIMAPNVTSVAIGSMKLVVEEGRFLLWVNDEPLIRAKDFAVSCFRLLPHTPVWAVGMNVTGTLKVDSVEQWHRFGDLLAPKQPWGDFVTDDVGKRSGGMRALVMERHRQQNDPPGHIRCVVQASETEERECAVQVNNHFALGSAEEPKDGSQAFRLIEDSWESVFAYSRETLEKVKAVADGA